MGSDCYQVEILHFLNPHLIWVEAKYCKTPNEFVFEQVGIYGLLPLETTIDLQSETLRTERSDEWTPASAAVMLQHLNDAKEIWFTPNLKDSRTTIFDDNIHKFGEIILLYPDKTQKKLSKVLVDRNLALFDVCVFHSELSNGQLKTKLSNVQTQEVIKQFDRYYKRKDKKEHYDKSVKKQTTVFQTAQEIQNALTSANLSRHDMKQQNENILLQKIKDLEMCKGVDEESVGCATKIKMIKKKDRDSSQIKELDTVQDEDILEYSKTSKVFDVTKDFIQKNSVKKMHEGYKLDMPLCKDKENLHLGAESHDITSPSSLKYTKDIEEIYNERIEITETESKDVTALKQNKENLPLKPDRAVKATRKETTATNTLPSARVKTRKSPAAVKERMVAFGPPGVNIQTLVSKVFYDTEPDGFNNENKSGEEISDIPLKYNSFQQDDREVGLGTTKRNNLLDRYKKFGVKNDFKFNVNENASILQTNNDEKPASSDSSVTKHVLKSKILQNKAKLTNNRTYKESHDNSFTSESDTTNKDTDSSLENSKEDVLDKQELERLTQKLRKEYKPLAVKNKKEIDPPELLIKNEKNNVNPLRNVDANISVFVDKVVTPVLMVHSKTDKRIEPRCELRDIPFGPHIQAVLKNLHVEHPMKLQKVSWFTILRGHSLIMISPISSGKTLGYLPAVCRLVTDSQTDSIGSVGPTAIIVCATSKSVTDVERISKMCLGLKDKVLACFAGMDEFEITTGLLNGCDLLICTPSILVRLLEATNFGVDLRRLATFILDDCERLAEVYGDEIKFFMLKIKDVMKNRVNKELKVQYILASRVWRDFMEPLAKKAPDTVVCIGAFQECVLYSKTPTTVKFVTTEKKPQVLFDCLKDVDTSKRIVIVCTENEEVTFLEKELTKLQYQVFACNKTMTHHDLYNLNLKWSDYQDPLQGPILLCCDINLEHLNVTDAHFLFHYSLPQLFSMFCRRFSVLNDHYPSIFKSERETVKIHVLVDDSNVEQLPKIVNFIRRCTGDLPERLEEVCLKVIAEKDVAKAKNYVPICDNLLGLGECPDFWNCQERHAVLDPYDVPKDWMPRSGVVTFKILHYHTAVLYSARLISNIVNGQVTKYPQTYSNLSLKMGMFYSKEANKQPHGIPQVGDVCAVSLKQNLFVRCQVLKILNLYPTGTPNYILIKLIDEEKYERSRDIYLYYLPEELKSIETHVVQVRLANVQPKDKDITFSELAREQLKKIADNDKELFLRGKISLSIGNCIFVDTLEACQTLTLLNETVVKHDFRHDLLNAHALETTAHMTKLRKLSGIVAQQAQDHSVSAIAKPLKIIPQWAHLEQDLSSVFLASAESPSNFFVRHAKFEDCVKLMLKDIATYVSENSNTVTEAKVGDIVLARFPDNATFERARVDEVFQEKTKCFFVDLGDWRDVAITSLVPITEKLVKQMPFQAIECRLIGVKPAGEDWTEFSTNWFSDLCYDSISGFVKNLYVKYFKKEVAESTNGYKYSVALIDTNGDDDVVINKLLIDVNLAQENEDEIEYLRGNLCDGSVKQKQETSDDDDWEKISDSNDKTNTISTVSSTNKLLEESPASLLFRPPTRSLPLIGEDESSDDFDKWDMNMASDFPISLQPIPSQSIAEKTNLPAINNETLVKSSAEIKTLLPLNNNNTLDSDDLTTPENTELSEPKINTPKPTTDEMRKPNLVWKQTKTLVTVKINIICDDYNLEIDKYNLKFSTIANDTNYGFELELYGVLDVPMCSHANKGHYILVKLAKLVPRNWLTLTKDYSLKKWIVYDMDSIDTSSDEEIQNDDYDKIVESIYNKRDSDTDDEEFMDDANFRYNK